jgi:hypothetical protein
LNSRLESCRIREDGIKYTLEKAFKLNPRTEIEFPSAELKWAMPAQVPDERIVNRATSQLFALEVHEDEVFRIFELGEDLLPNVIADAVQERKWNSNFRNELVLERKAISTQSTCDRCL